MHFLLRHTPGTGHTLELDPGTQVLHRSDLGPKGTLLLLGDPVLDVHERLDRMVNAAGGIDTTALYGSVRGHYYWFHQLGNTLTFGSSFGAILPVYHQRNAGVFEASSSQYTLARRLGAPERDRRYLLERYLFNYPLFDRTPWRAIRLLDAHAHVRLDAEGVRSNKDFTITDHFGSGLLRGERDLDDLCTAFAQECQRHLPGDTFGISLTGGLDGRTLLAAARQAGRRDLFTYSFGVPGEEDVTLPMSLAARLGVEHLPIILDEHYVARLSLASAHGFMELSEFNGNLGRPHYHHAARMLAGRTRYILTGNFGSELFRALHQPGVMMTAHLIAILAARDASWKDHLRAAALPGMSTETDGLIEDLSTWLRGAVDLTPNQRLYRFVLEELFRKYFGPELVMQAHFLRNRTPFLSLPFFRAVNATRWAGVHADLFDRNKHRRMKGQVFYAAFLRRSDPVLYRSLTSKGYGPADVLERRRMPLLLLRIVAHKLGGKDHADSNAVHAFFQRHGAAITTRHAADDPLPAWGADAHPSIDERIHRASLAMAWSAAGHTLSPPRA